MTILYYIHCTLFNWCRRLHGCSGAGVLRQHGAYRTGSACFVYFAAAIIIFLDFWFYSLGAVCVFVRVLSCLFVFRHVALLLLLPLLLLEGETFVPVLFSLVRWLLSAKLTNRNIAGTKCHFLYYYFFMDPSGR